MEKALAWVQGLGERSFVGTESRLNTIFELLRQIVYGTETDPDSRIAGLLSRRRELDDQISRVQAGEIDLLDASAVRDRYQQLSATARELLADFREVEENSWLPRDAGQGEFLSAHHRQVHPGKGSAALRGAHARAPWDALVEQGPGDPLLDGLTLPILFFPPKDDDA